MVKWLDHQRLGEQLVTVKLSRNNNAEQNCASVWPPPCDVNNVDATRRNGMYSAGKKHLQKNSVNPEEASAKVQHLVGLDTKM